MSSASFRVHLSRMWLRESICHHPPNIPFKVGVLPSVILLPCFLHIVLSLTECLFLVCGIRGTSGLTYRRYNHDCIFGSAILPAAGEKPDRRRLLPCCGLKFGIAVEYIQEHSRSAFPPGGRLSLLFQL
jgi:hypothetical protein